MRRLIQFVFVVLFVICFFYFTLGIVVAERDFELGSIIGGNRDCSKNPDNLFEINFSEIIDIEKIIFETCESGFGVVDSFDSDYIPYIEYKDGIFECFYEEGCFIEIYCCPYNECVVDNDCKKNKGILSKCEKIFCENNGEGYVCNVDSLIEKEILYQYSELNYCTESLKINIILFVIILIVIGLLITLFFNRKKFK